MAIRMSMIASREVVEGVKRIKAAQGNRPAAFSDRMMASKAVVFIPDADAIAVLVENISSHDAAQDRSGWRRDERE